MDVRDPVPTDLFAEAAGELVSVTRTGAEISLICPSALAPEVGTAEHGWRLLSVRGPLEFTLTGIIAAIASELAAAGVALFSLSTYDTDHVLVREVDRERAVRALEESGHEVHTG
nr:ACT domain-containing protein [Haloechinothrix aidingensis]